MAITSKPFLQFFYGLTGGSHQMVYNQYALVLLKPDFIYDPAMHDYYDVSFNELENNGDYYAGGVTIQNKTVSTGVVFWTLGCDPVSFGIISGQIRYCAVYRQPNDEQDQPLVMLIDFGETIELDNEEFIVEFPDGFVTLRGA